MTHDEMERAIEILLNNQAKNSAEIGAFGRHRERAGRERERDGRDRERDFRDRERPG